MSDEEDIRKLQETVKNQQAEISSLEGLGKKAAAIAAIVGLAAAAIGSVAGYLLKFSDYQRDWDSLRQAHERIVSAQKVLDHEPYALKERLDDYILREDLLNALKVPELEALDTSVYALKTDIPTVPETLDLSSYALKSDLPKALNLSAYARKSDLPKAPNLSVYALKNEINKMSLACRVVTHGTVATCSTDEVLTGGGATCDGTDALPSGVTINTSARTVTYSNYNNPATKFCWNGGWGRAVKVQAVCCKVR